MHHRVVREIMPALLAGSGFNSRSLSLVNCARLADLPFIDNVYVDRLIRRAADLSVHSVIAEQPSIGDALPDTQEQFVGWALQQAISQPAQMGTQLASIWALADLWPHAQRDERLQLRRLWLWSLMARKADSDSYVSRETLAEWQRNLPTVHCFEQPSPKALAAMLSECSAESAHHALSSFLGPDLHIPTLCWMLGVVAGRGLLSRFDLRSQGQQSLLGSVACEKICEHADPHEMIIAVMQLAHEIWYTFRRDTRELRPGSDDATLGLEEAIHRGDYTAAQRAARQAIGDTKRFWAIVWSFLDEFSIDSPEHWPRALHAVIIAATRAGSENLNPDDAAVLGGCLAGANWLSGKHQVA